MNITSADGGYAVRRSLCWHHRQDERNRTHQKLGVIQIPGSGTTVNVPMMAAQLTCLSAQQKRFDRDVRHSAAEMTSRNTQRKFNFRSNFTARR